MEFCINKSYQVLESETIEVVEELINIIKIDPELLTEEEREEPSEEPREKELKKPSISVDSAIALIGKEQDRVRTGPNWVVVQDGHGYNDCIDFLDTLHYDEIMQLENPAEEIQRRIMASRESFIKSGSTLCIARVIPGNVIEIINVGDSQAEVYIDGQLVFVSKPHGLTFAETADPEELERVKPFLHPVTPSRSGKTLKAISHEIITQVENKICNFRCGRSIVPTMVLGHENMTGFAPTKTYLSFNPGQRVRVCVYSDGVGDMRIENDAQDQADMQSMTAQQLLDKFVGRWRKEWQFAPDETRLDKLYPTTMSGGYDDVCIGIVDIF
jgi:hypothetical protein